MPFRMGDRVQLDSDRARFRLTHTLEYGDSLCDVSRGDAGEILSAADAAGDYCVRWDNGEHGTCAGDLLSAESKPEPELVDARAAAEVTERRLRELAACAAVRIEALEAQLAAHSGCRHRTRTHFFREILNAASRVGPRPRYLAALETELDE